MHTRDWAAAREMFEAAQQAAGLAATTAERQGRIVQRFGQLTGRPPWEVSSREVVAYLDAHPGSVRTVKTARQTLRAFYRWGMAHGFMSQQPVPEPAPVTRYRLADQWQDALGAFERAQAHASITAASVRLRVKHLTRFAAACGLGPWEVTVDTVREWLESLTVTDHTRRANRTSLRAFYRWAYREGRVVADPTEQLSSRLRKLGVPAQWAPEVEAYTIHLRAGGRQETTIDTHADILGRFAREHSSLGPWEVSADDLMLWTGRKRWKSETRRHARMQLISFYRWAVTTGRTDSNPAEALPSVPAAPPAPRPAHDHEYRTALDAAPDRERLAIRLAGELGLRCAEVAQVHTGDVQPASAGGWTLTVRGKGQRTRQLPLPVSLATVLRDREAGFVFPGQDAGHLSPRYLSKRVSELLPPGVTMHALRHRFATRAYNVNRDVFTVQQLLGHASPATTQRYVLVEDTAKRQLVELLAAE
ncbi:MAG: tyrosine-type recombinase/integrase [Leucobacter sp.]